MDGWSGGRGVLAGARNQHETGLATMEMARAMVEPMAIGLSFRPEASVALQ